MNPLQSNKAISQGAGWLTLSGIQHVGDDRRLNGGVFAWYDLAEQRYPYLQSEITGYAISMFVFLNRISGEGR